LRSMAQWHATQSAGDCSRLAKFMSRIEVRNGVEVLPVAAMVAPVAPGDAAAAAAVAVAETELPTSGETESMADDDFLNELRNLSS